MKSIHRVSPGCAIETMPAGRRTIAMTASGWGPRRGTNAGQPVAEQSLEGVVAVLRVTGAHQRVGDLRPADAAAARARGRDERLPNRSHNRERQAGHRSRERVELRWSRCDSRKSLSSRIRCVEKVAEHVHVAPVLDRGNLDAGDQPNAVTARRLCRFGQAGAGVVVGHADRA